MILIICSILLFLLLINVLITPLANAMYANSILLKNWIANTPNNDATEKPSQTLAETVKEFKDKLRDPTTSKAYCEIKLDVIKTMSSNIQKTSGSKGK